MEEIIAGRKRVRQILEDLAEYYSIRLSENQIEMYIEDLIDIDAQALGMGVLRYRRTNMEGVFPLPAKLRIEVRFAKSLGLG